MVALAGKLVFADLMEPVPTPGFEKNGRRYSATLLVSKDDTAGMQKLQEVVERVADKAWGSKAEEMLESIWGAVEQGVKPRFSPINVQDGDLHYPEYNAGHWVISVRRKEEAGRPALITREGQLCFDEQGDLAVPVAEVPRKFDGVVVVFEVWAQSSQDRVNFKLEAVRKAVASENLSLAPPNPAAVAMLAGMELPTAIAGVSVPQLSEGDVDRGLAEDEPVASQAAEAKPKRRAKAKPVEAEVVEEPKKTARKSLFR